MSRLEEDSAITSSKKELELASQEMIAFCRKNSFDDLIKNISEEKLIPNETKFFRGSDLEPAIKYVYCGPNREDLGLMHKDTVTLIPPKQESDMVPFDILDQITEGSVILFNHRIPDRTGDESYVVIKKELFYEDKFIHLNSFNPKGSHNKTWLGRLSTDKPIHLVQIIENESMSVVIPSYINKGKLVILSYSDGFLKASINVSVDGVLTPECKLAEPYDPYTLGPVITLQWLEAKLRHALREVS